MTALTKENHFNLIGDRTGYPAKTAPDYEEKARRVYESKLGFTWEITEATYNAFRSKPGPLYAPNGFYSGDLDIDDITTLYTARNGKFYCQYARLPKGEEIS